MYTHRLHNYINVYIMFAHLRRWHFGSGKDIAYVSLDTP